MTAPLVVVTRREAGPHTLSAALDALGVRVRALPTIEVVPVDDPAPLDAALESLSSFDWLVITSARAVDALAARPEWTRTWKDAAPRPRVATVGRATAARLRAAGAPVDRVGEGAGADDLVGELVAAEGETLRGARVLWPRSDRAPSVLAEGLEAAGARVTAPIAYRTLPARPADIAWFSEALDRGEIAAIAFLSPSAATGLASALGADDLARLRGRTLVASIGPTTGAALRELGAPADVEAPEPSGAALAAALMARLAPQGVVP